MTKHLLASRTVKEGKEPKLNHLHFDKLVKHDVERAL